MSATDSIISPVAYQWEGRERVWREGAMRALCVTINFLLLLLGPTYACTQHPRTCIQICLKNTSAKHLQTRTRQTTLCNNTLQQHSATYPNRMQYTATHRNTLPHLTSKCNQGHGRQHTATHCNTLQQTIKHCHTYGQLETKTRQGTHCNTMKHTATQ